MNQNFSSPGFIQLWLSRLVMVSDLWAVSSGFWQCPTWSQKNSFWPLMHKELEDLATSPQRRYHETRTTVLYPFHQPCPRHVNWKWSSSFETALLQTLCRTFSWGQRRTKPVCAFYFDIWSTDIVLDLDESQQCLFVMCENNEDSEGVHL